jgi:hypothetical protein
MVLTAGDILSVLDSFLATDWLSWGLPLFSDARERHGLTASDAMRCSPKFLDFLWFGLVRFDIDFIRREIAMDGIVS